MCRCLQSDSSHKEFWAPELRRPSQVSDAAGSPFPLRGSELPARSALASPATVEGRLIISGYPPPGRLLTCAEAKGVLL